MSVNRVADSETPSNPVGASRLGQFISSALLIGACVVGASALAVAIISPGLEWRLLTLVSLGIVTGSMRVRISGAGSEQVTIPFAHQVMFASSLTLGPAAAALPGAFVGIGRSLSRRSELQTVFQLFYAVLKPAAVCAAAAGVYVLSGGSAARPQSVGAIDSILLAALAYAAASAILTGSLEGIKGREPSGMCSRQRVFAAWIGAFVGGYGLAVLYALAPSYVLVAPVIAAALARLALRQSAVESTPESATTAVEAEESEAAQPRFMDRATGLANRNYADMFLDGEVSRSGRKRKSVSVAVFDVHGFRKLVESYGQESADQLLADMGTKLKSGVRDYDLVTRYSDGRLMMVLPETSMDLAMEAAERLYGMVSSMDLRGTRVSIAVGVATFPQHGSTAAELVNSAHHALNIGRFASADGVHVAESLPQAG